MITPHNVSKLMESLKRQIKQQNGRLAQPSYLIMPPVIRTMRYRGKGRPRKSDYENMHELVERIKITLRHDH